MLQFSEFYQNCYEEFRKKYLSHQNPEDLVDKFFHFIETQRASSFHRESGLRKWLLALDKWIWTDKRELLDQDHVPFSLKKKIIKGLDLKNNLFGTYHASLRILAPMIRQINQEEGRPARILELAGGMGNLSLRLQALCLKKNLKVEITCSDIIPEYMEEGRKEAEKRKLDVKFQVIDAYALDLLPPGSFDMAFTLHSMHHFTPGQLARIIAGSQKVVTRSFIGLDGVRGMGNLLFIVVTGGIGSLFNGTWVHLHDALLSGRKMYACKQLELAASLAAPESSTLARNIFPGLTLLKVSPPSTSCSPGNS